MGLCEYCAVESTQNVCGDCQDFLQRRFYAKNATVHNSTGNVVIKFPSKEWAEEAVDSWNDHQDRIEHVGKYHVA